MAKTMAYTNIGEALPKLKALKDLIPANVVEAVRGISIAAFEFIISETPQWSGSMTASTRIYPGRIDYSYTPIVGTFGGKYRSDKGHSKGGTDIYGKRMAIPTGDIKSVTSTRKKGDSAAQEKARNENAGHLSSYDYRKNKSVLGQEIFITNNVKNKGSSKSYAMAVELNMNAQGSKFLRIVNLESGMYKRAAIKFGNKGTLTDAELDTYIMIAKRSKLVGG